MAFLAEVGAERDSNEQTKTRWALGYYAAKLQPPSKPKASARKAPAAKQVPRLARKSAGAHADKHGLSKKQRSEPRKVRKRT